MDRDVLVSKIAQLEANLKQATADFYGWQGSLAFAKQLLAELDNPPPPTEPS